jgi:hypothetical protein
VNCRGTSKDVRNAHCFQYPILAPRTHRFCTGLEFKAAATVNRRFQKVKLPTKKLQRPASKVPPTKGSPSDSGGPPVFSGLYRTPSTSSGSAWLRSVWALSGLCLGSAWALSGLCLGFVWALPRLCLGSVWALSGLYLGSAWALSGLCLGSVWALSGLCLGSVWALSGLFLGSVWALPGLCV